MKINTSPKRMYARARSKEGFDFTRHYGLGNSVRGVACAVALAALRTTLLVRRYALEIAVGRVSNARELVRPPPSSESDCTRVSWAEIRIGRCPVAPTSLLRAAGISSHAPGRHRPALAPSMERSALTFLQSSSAKPCKRAVVSPVPIGASFSCTGKNFVLWAYFPMNRLRRTQFVFGMVASAPAGCASQIEKIAGNVLETAAASNWNFGTTGFFRVIRLPNRTNGSSMAW
jgi:hypothetical protein